MERSKNLVVLFVIFASQLVGAPPAAANNFYGATGDSPCGGNMQDSGVMTWYRQDLEYSHGATSDAIINAVVPTDVVVAAESSSHGAGVDVVYQDFNYTGSICGITWHPAGTLVGYTSCVTLSGAKCDHFHVLYDTSYTSGLTVQQKRNLACHETGHSLGLSHPDADEQRNDSCMYDVTEKTYSDHDLDHINDNY